VETAVSFWTEPMTEVEAAARSGVAWGFPLWLLLLLLASPALGQSRAVPCERAVTGSMREACAVVAQAAEAAPAQLGILVARGNATIGSASPGGLRLGVLPRVSASAQGSVVMVKLPDILARQAGTGAERLNRSVGIPAPALSGTATVSVFEGFRLLPTVGGFGSVDAIGSAAWLPFAGGRGEGFGPGGAELAYGVGARIGLLRETFVTPGASISVMRHSLGEVRYGDVCPGIAVIRQGTGEGYTYASGECPGGGDPGEISVDVSSWSTRAQVGKRLLGVGLVGGLGYDRFASTAGYGFRAEPSTLPQGVQFARVGDLQRTTGRWSAFVNGSYTLIVATLGVEAGWMQGSRPIQGFPAISDFDPRDGTFFGSVGARLAL
jgi:hypothetical protein